jgi:hypothetical protein
MDRLLLSVIAIGLAAATAAACLVSDRFVVLVIPLAAVAVVLLVNQGDKCVARRMEARNRAAQPAPKWAIALLVDADEESRILRPIVQLLGPQLPNEVTVTLRVCDQRGDVRLTTERRFSEPGTRSDLVLGTLAVPDGLLMAEIVRCDWAVMVSHNGHEIARRSGPLTAAACLNDEAELRAPDLEPEPKVVEPPPATPGPARNWRVTIALTSVSIGCATGGYLLTTLSAWLCFAAVPLIWLAGMMLVAASLALNAPCPRCGRLTTVAGRTGAQRCDACRAQFTLRPGSL